MRGVSEMIHKQTNKTIPESFYDEGSFRGNPKLNPKPDARVRKLQYFEDLIITIMKMMMMIIIWSQS